MTNFVAVTTSNRPRLRDPTAVRAVLDRYALDFDVGAWIETDEASGEEHLMICGQGWPRAPRLTEDMHPMDFPPSDWDDDPADFEQLLQELAPHLAEPLTIQAVAHDDCCFPLLAREWHIEPGNADVRVNGFQYGHENGSSAERTTPATANAPGPLTGYAQK